MLEGLLDEISIEGKKMARVPETSQGPLHQIAAVECEQMIVSEVSIAFMAILKHASFFVQKVELPRDSMKIM